MAKYVPLSEAELNNDSSIFSSVAAGFASGILKTIEGGFSLGAELIDLGADTNKAAEVEQFFDDINIFEDTAQDRVAGKLVEVFTQIGIPGTAGFKAATKLADKAIKAKKSGNYMNSKSKSVQEGMKTAQSLNDRIPGKTKRFAAGVFGGAAGETLVAALKPTPPGIPICVNTSTSLPATLSCAVSSNIFTLSKNCSTSAALFVSAPRSISSAPRDTTPSTVLRIPDAKPAATDENILLSLFSSASDNGTYFAI